MRVGRPRSARTCLPAYPPTRSLAIFHTHADAFRIFASQPLTIGSWRLARASRRANGEPGHRAPVLPASRCHGGDRISGGVHPVRGLHRCLSRARTPQGSGRRRSRRRHAVSLAGCDPLYRLPHHALCRCLPHTGTECARAGLVRIPARRSRASARALPHLSGELMSHLRRCLSHGRSRADSRRCWSSLASA
jgi:hypothetical protein